MDGRHRSVREGFSDARPVRCVDAPLHQFAASRPWQKRDWPQRTRAHSGQSQAPVVRIYALKRNSTTSPHRATSSVTRIAAPAFINVKGLQLGNSTATARRSTPRASLDGSSRRCAISSTNASEARYAPQFMAGAMMRETMSLLSESRTRTERAGTISTPFPSGNFGSSVHSSSTGPSS